MKMNNNTHLMNEIIWNWMKIKKKTKKERIYIYKREDNGGIMKKMEENIHFIETCAYSVPIIMSHHL